MFPNRKRTSWSLAVQTHTSWQAHATNFHSTANSCKQTCLSLFQFAPQTMHSLHLCTPPPHFSRMHRYLNMAKFQKLSHPPTHCNLTQNTQHYFFQPDRLNLWLTCWDFCAVFTLRQNEDNYFIIYDIRYFLHASTNYLNKHYTFFKTLSPHKILLSYIKLYWSKCTTIAVLAHDTAGQVLFFINITVHPS